MRCWVGVERVRAQGRTDHRSRGVEPGNCGQLKRPSELISNAWLTITDEDPLPAHHSPTLLKPTHHGYYCHRHVSSSALSAAVRRSSDRAATDDRHRRAPVPERRLRRADDLNHHLRVGKLAVHPSHPSWHQIARCYNRPTAHRTLRPRLCVPVTGAPLLTHHRDHQPSGLRQHVPTVARRLRAPCDASPWRRRKPLVLRVDAALDA